MGRTGIALMVAFMFATGNHVRAADCGLVNASFEADALISDVRVQHPSGWDASLPAGMFSGSVVSSEPTDGLYSLRLSTIWFVTFSGGETATVSQIALLDSVDEIVFDLKLATSGRAVGWDPNVCTAVVLIDEDVIWESNFARADIRGDYPDQVAPVDEKYRDGGLHRLSLGLRMHANGVFFEMYDSYWDAIECRLRDDSGDFLPGDFNRDGFVGASDMMMMAEMWLADVPADSALNLGAGDEEDPNGVVGIVNFFDLAVLGENWLGSSLVQVK
jgi:hypothetical protein